MESKISLIIIFIILIKEVELFTPLRFGADQSHNDIQIRYFANQNNPKAKSFGIIITSNFDYIKMNTQFSFCFALMKTVTSQNNINCDLEYENNMYDCLTIETNQEQINNYTYWKMDIDYNIVSNISLYEFTIQKNINMIILLKGKADNKPFNFLPQPNRIYKVLTNNAKNFDYKDSIRVNYLSTLPSKLDKSSDNLLMQRQVVCYYYKNIVNLLFLGGVVRNNHPYYILSTLHYQLDKRTFIMWQGLSFSIDKASRDMVGINPVTSTVQDLYSLYARAPFPDVSKNINATENWNMFSNSIDGVPFQPTWHYQTHIFRLYDTEDDLGDEIIRFKIQNKYCYVASFIKNEQFNDQIMTSFTYTNNSYYHELLQCFVPILDLHYSIFSVLVTFILILLIL